MPLNKLKNLLVPQDGVFFELMKKQAETAYSASQMLLKLLEDYENVEEGSKCIRGLEHEGDQLVRDLHAALNRTFIVPIDHNDISLLGGALDDIIDSIDRTATSLVIYNITSPLPAAIRLSKILLEQTNELCHAVAAINHSRTYNKVSNHCTKINQLESTADDIYIEAVGSLFRKNNAMSAIKNKEILDSLEEAIDKADKAASNLLNIVMKHS